MTFKLIFAFACIRVLYVCTSGVHLLRNIVENGALFSLSIDLAQVKWRDKTDVHGSRSINEIRTNTGHLTSRTPYPFVSHANGIRVFAVSGTSINHLFEEKVLPSLSSVCVYPKLLSPQGVIL